MKEKTLRFSLNPIAALLLIVFSALAQAAGLADISNRDASSGLKQALADSASIAVQKLGVANGFLANDKVRIPLPESMQRIEGVMRAMGMKRQADELVTAMNRAAETAVAEAKPLLIDAVQKMTLQDAKGILTGSDTAATEYFRRTTAEQLGKRFLPIVKKATDQVGLAEQYNSLASQGARFGLVKGDQVTIEEYVTQKALDGLYLIIGEQEKALRTNPVGAASDIVRKVFGAIR